MLPNPSNSLKTKLTAACSYRLKDYERTIENIRGRKSYFALDISGFVLHYAPEKETSFANDKDIQEGYYTEIQALLRQSLTGVEKVVIFDHTVRRNLEGAPRQPLQLVHIDQTTHAAEMRVRRHLEAERLLNHRYQIINGSRSIQNVASDMPLAVLDEQIKDFTDFVQVHILYPKEYNQCENSP